MNPDEALVSPQVGNALEVVETNEVGQDTDQGKEEEPDTVEQEAGDLESEDELHQQEARDVLRR